MALQQDIIHTLVDTILEEETAVIHNQITLRVAERLQAIGEKPDAWVIISLYEKKGEEITAAKILNSAQELRTVQIPQEIQKIIREETAVVNAQLKVAVDRRCAQHGIDVQTLNFQVEHHGLSAYTLGNNEQIRNNEQIPISR